jgi:hypothetical protein
MVCSEQAPSDHVNLPFRDRMIMESERISGERPPSRSTTAPTARAVSNRPDASVTTPSAGGLGLPPQGRAGPQILLLILV